MSRASVPPPYPYHQQVVIRPRPTWPPKRKSQWPWLVFSAFCLMALFCLGALAPTNKHGDKYDAYIYAKEFVSDALRAPATADFPWEPESAALKGTIWHVAGHVDSQNGFGALIRSHWTCQVEKRGDKWRCHSLVIDGQRVI